MTELIIVSLLLSAPRGPPKHWDWHIPCMTSPHSPNDATTKRTHMRFNDIKESVQSHTASKPHGWEANTDVSSAKPGFYFRRKLSSQPLFSLLQDSGCQGKFWLRPAQGSAPHPRLRPSVSVVERLGSLPTHVWFRERNTKMHPFINTDLRVQISIKAITCDAFIGLW